MSQTAHDFNAGETNVKTEFWMSMLVVSHLWLRYTCLTRHRIPVVKDTLLAPRFPNFPGWRWIRRRLSSLRIPIIIDTRLGSGLHSSPNLSCPCNRGKLLNRGELLNRGGSNCSLHSWCGLLRLPRRCHRHEVGKFWRHDDSSLFGW